MARKTTKTTTAARKTPVRRTAKPSLDLPEAAPETVLPKVVKTTEPVVAEPDLKKKELIDLVVERSGVKKKFAKPAVEAMLAVLGEAIADGRPLNLQPLGKLRVNRAEDKANGRVTVAKIRQSAPADNDSEEPKTPLAEPAE
ncbi:HU family DNA-binding protein [Lutimaribacter marinistellae]|uniref:HU family DNA-binding protein n=1 Tax=Lutimaribacter marinistellae TaxID=1820329 RepID=A0ABV7TJD7_9RHOB